MRQSSFWRFSHIYLSDVSHLAFQTAVSLAEYEDERDEEGKIKLTDEHLRAVVELSKDFKAYLRDLHKADEDKRALKRYERLDT